MLTALDITASGPLLHSPDRPSPRVITPEPLCRAIPLQARKILKYSLYHATKVILFGSTVLAMALWLVRHDLVFGVHPEEAPGLALAGGAGLAILAFSKAWYHVLHFYSYYYDIQNGSLVIRKGVIAQREATLPFSRITDVWVEQDLADVILGLYDVHISTPTAESGAFAHISGVNKRGAAGLRRMLLENINGAARVQ